MLSVTLSVWIVAWKKIQKCDNLMKREITSEDWKCMCSAAASYCKSIAMHCDIAYALETYIFSMFGVQGVLQRSVVDRLSG